MFAVIPRIQAIATINTELNLPALVNLFIRRMSAMRPSRGPIKGINPIRAATTEAVISAASVPFFLRIFIAHQSRAAKKMDCTARLISRAPSDDVSSNPVICLRDPAIDESKASFAFILQYRRIGVNEQKSTTVEMGGIA